MPGKQDGGAPTHIKGGDVWAGRTSCHHWQLCKWPSFSLAVLWASSWLTYHSTSPLLPGLRCMSLPSGTDLQGMPLDTCHPGPGWRGPKTSHKHHEQSQTPSSLSPGLSCSQPPNPRLSHHSASQGHASLTQCEGSGHACSRISLLWMI